MLLNINHKRKYRVYKCIYYTRAFFFLFILVHSRVWTFITRNVRCTSRFSYRAYRTSWILYRGKCKIRRKFWSRCMAIRVYTGVNNPKPRVNRETRTVFGLYRATFSEIHFDYLNTSFNYLPIFDIRLFVFRITSTWRESTNNYRNVIVRATVNFQRLFVK